MCLPENAFFNWVLLSEGMTDEQRVYMGSSTFSFSKEVHPFYLSVSIIYCQSPQDQPCKQLQFPCHNAAHHLPKHLITYCCRMKLSICFIVEPVNMRFEVDEKRRLGGRFKNRERRRRQYLSKKRRSQSVSCIYY